MYNSIHQRAGTPPEGRNPMSTSTIWLILVIVAAIIILFSALYKKKFTARELAVIGLMAALSFIAYEFLRIPNVFGTKSSFHLGNTFTALTAMLLDGVSGGLSGAIGIAMADVVAGDPGYAITTFVLKFIIGIVCGVFAHRVFKIRTRKVEDGLSYYAAIAGSAFSGLLVNVITDPLLGFFRNVYIFGQDVSVASVWTKIAGGVTFVNSVLSAVCAVILYLALHRALTKSGLIK